VFGAAPAVVLVGSALSLLQVAGAAAIVLAAFGLERDPSGTTPLPG
jgi:hypothetical protein